MLEFLVIPALDLKDKKCVQLVQGDPSKKIVELEEPVSIAKHWEEKGARRLHLIDLDGAILGERKNEGIVKEIVKELSIPVQFGGGIRSLEDAIHFLDLGVEKIILGTLAIKSPEIVEKLEEKYGKERIIIALDSKQGYVAIKGWKKTTKIKATELAKKFESLVEEFLFTNIDVEGKMRGINEKIIKEVISSTKAKVIVSGGISSVEDVKKIKSLGAGGVVIGSALYTGKISFDILIGEINARD
ncbi:MAG: 1-(5-phosphoribosyl)-5-((5-phosphoribosylamino)methylideneamino)imidazole-4-carboxamide isomerase [Candidatus Hydrothermarchaeota archaeon]|nr:MAG: 1-(5-phosphoribosyl)-5-((5-phosphoribosylamino)methylideneamino)imidazole-4-carboxamide isomerase [Candidatus Hydrothermarchaeota archaeon]